MDKSSNQSRRRSSKRLLPKPLMAVAKGVRAALISYLLVLLLMTFLERWLVYPIPSPDRGNWQPKGLEFEDIRFTSADNTRLHGWYLPHQGSVRSIVYCHGNGEHVADNVNLVKFLRDRLNASVFIFDYRGYGLSEGVPHEAGVVADGLAAQRWLADREGIECKEIVVMGRSIGGAVAIAMAAEQGAHSLVLESTFAKMTDAAARHYPWLPVRILMKNRYDSLARVSKYEGPVFQSHGTIDQIVPIADGRRLFEAIPSPNKVFLEIPHRGHNDNPPENYYTQLAEFLEELSGLKKPFGSSP